MLLALSANSAMANTQTKLNVVKQAYGEAVRCMNNDCNSDPVKKYMDNRLKKLSLTASSMNILQILEMILNVLVLLIFI